MDKLDGAYRGEIPKVVSFSQKVALNYDCLRAISFELNQGLPFEKAIQDLNIINMGNEQYEIILHYSNGMILGASNVRLNLFATDCSAYIWLHDDEDHSVLCVEFDPCMVTYDESRNISIIPAEKLKMTYSEHLNEQILDRFKKMMPEYLSITRIGERELHYWFGGADKKQPVYSRRGFHCGDIPF